MAALSRILRSQDGDRIAFWCPGCKCAHAVRVAPAPEPWAYNGDPKAPTFAPSVLVRWSTSEPPVTPENLVQWKAAPWPQTTVEHVCHSFVTDGRIQFLADCTHALAGQTVPLPDFP
jgi:hypothetical protein